MIKLRLRFTKEGKAKYISHLDLMRTMERAFFRAGIAIRHTEGFNPHPYLSFALPLPVGMESGCELMDFELTGGLPPKEIPTLLNTVLPEGLRVTDIYEPSRKMKEIAWLRIRGRFIYDGGVNDGCATRYSRCFKETASWLQRKQNGERRSWILSPSFRQSLCSKAVWMN